MAATTTTLLLGAQGVGAFSNVAGSIVQAQAIRAQGDIAKRVSKANAAEARRLAEEELETGEAKANRNRRDILRLIGAQRVSQAAGGADASAAIAETQLIGTAESLSIRTNALRRAFGFETRALAFESQGRLAKIQARTQARQTVISAGAQFGSDLVQGAATFQQDPFLFESSRPTTPPPKLTRRPAPTRPVGGSRIPLSR